MNARRQLSAIFASLPAAPTVLCIAVIAGYAVGAAANTAYAQSLEVVIQSGHLAEIRDVAYSPDGCFIATAGADNRVKLWDETTGTEIHSFRGGVTPHTVVKFSTDGRSLFIGTEGGPATRWNVTSGELITQFPASESVSLAVSARGAGRMMTTGGEIGSKSEILLWDVDSGAQLQSFEWPSAGIDAAPQFDERHLGKKHEPNKVAINSDGTQFATAGREGRTVLWNTHDTVPLRFFNLESALEENPSFLEQMGQVSHIAVAFSPDDKYLAGAFSTQGHLWALKPGDVDVTLTGHRGAITSIAFSDDGQFVATGDTTGIVKVWTVSGGREVQSLQAHAGTVHGMAFKPSGDDVRCETQLVTRNEQLAGRVLVTSGADSVARIWTLGEARMIRALTPKVQPLNDVAFSPDGSRLAIASSASPNGVVKIWDLTSGYDVTSLSGHIGGVNAVRFSPDGLYIATAGADGTTAVWDAASLSLQFRIGEARDDNRFGNILAGIVGIAALSNKDVASLIGNSSINSTMSTVKHSTSEGARAIAFSADSRYLAVGGRDNTEVWDVTNATRSDVRIKNNLADKLVFTPDGRELLAGGIGAFRVSVESGKVLKKLANKFFGLKGGVSTVDLHPAGDRLAIAYSHGRLEVLRFADGKGAQKIEREIAIRALRFSPDGTLLAAGDVGGNILVFEVGEHLTKVKEWSAHSDIVFGLAFSPDTRTLASVSADGTARLWNTQTWEEQLSFVSIGPEDYVILTPDNYYAASTNGHVGLAFRLGNVVYPFEQFDLQLNRPDIVFSRLSSVPDDLLQGYRNAYEKRSRRRGLDPERASNFDQLPEVEIVDLPRRAATSEQRLTFKVVARDANYPISSIDVWVNGVPLSGSAGYKLAGTERNVTHTFDLELSQGRNRIQVSATNVRGLESVRSTIETIYEPPSPRKPDLYVIAIGVSDYGDETINLAYAAKDATDLAAALSQQDRFRSIHQVVLTDAEAIRERIVDLKRDLLATRVDDEVVLFVAGHGVVDRNLDYYFATPDIDFDEPSARGLSDEQLEWLLDGIPARRKLLLMDTCYSGEIDTDPQSEVVTAGVAEGVVVRNIRGVQSAAFVPATSGVDAFNLMQKIFANLGRGSGAVVISAAGGTEFAFEGQNNSNGVFTYSVLEAIGHTADDDFLRLSQLRQQVVARVRALTGGLQTPGIRRINLDFDYPVWSKREPVISDVPEIDTSDFGKLFMQAAEQSVLEDY